MSQVDVCEPDTIRPAASGESDSAAPVRCRFRGVLLPPILIACLSLPGLLSLTERSFATTAEVLAPPGCPLQINVVDLEPAFATAPDRGPAPLRLTLQVHIHNHFSTPLQIDRDQFVLLINGSPAARSPAGNGTEFRNVTLDPGQDATGSLCFSDIDCSAGEPLLALRWIHGELSSVLSLNDHLRRIYTVHEWRLGTDSCLQMLSTGRNLDILAVWVLHDVLQRVRQDGIQRVVLCPHDSTSLQLTDEAAGWLATASANLPEGHRNSSPPLPFPPAPVQFVEIHVGGFVRPSQRRTTSGHTAGLAHRLVDDAVYAAVRSLYHRVDERRAFVDISHEHPGISRAAIEGSVDRLSPARTSELLQLTRTGPPATRLLVTSHLDRISGNGVVPVLLELSLSEDAVLSEAAVFALARSSDPQAETAMYEVWQTSEHKELLRSRIVDAMLKSRNFLWCRLLAACAADAIGLHVGQSVPRADVPVDFSGLKSADGQDRHVVRLRAILEFLKLHHDDSTTETVRDTLLQIENVAVQDVAVEFLLQFQQEQDASLIRRFLQQRFQHGTVTDIVRTAAAVYPEPAWAPALLSDFHHGKTQSAARRKSLSAALRCCAGQQLDQLVSEFHSLDVQSQAMLLSQLSAVQHPAWREIAGRVLENHEPLAGEAMDILSQDGAELSLRILNAQLAKRIGTAEATDLADDAGRRSQTERLISKISLFSHPECRRMLNRCLRHPDEQIRSRADGAMRAALRRSPGEALLKDVARLKSEQKFAEAMTKAGDCLAVDEFLPDAYLSRAALWLRKDDLPEAMRDLQMADRLSPEDPSTQSTMALALVRMGQLDQGLLLADQALLLDPHSSHMLYNSACVRARAAESVALPESRRTELLQQATELLHQSAESEFSDLMHLQQDPDLVLLHSRPEWPMIVKRIEQNLAQRTPAAE